MLTEATSDLDAPLLGGPSLDSRVRRELAEYGEVQQDRLARLTAQVADILSAPVVAYALHVEEPTLGSLSQATGRQSDLERLCTINVLAREIRNTFSPGWTQSWFVGTNATLDGAAPIQIIRRHQYAEYVPRLAAALERLMAPSRFPSAGE